MVVYESLNYRTIVVLRRSESMGEYKSFTDSITFRFAVRIMQSLVSKLLEWHRCKGLDCSQKARVDRNPRFIRTYSLLLREIIKGFKVECGESSDDAPFYPCFVSSFMERLDVAFTLMGACNGSG